MYPAHHDFRVKGNEPSKLGTGNRVATALFYVRAYECELTRRVLKSMPFQLSDVEKGGATVFPYLRIRVSPRKGSAVFWYNLSSSGEPGLLA